MDKFTWFFPADRFTLYKTWKHNSSVIYRLTTWTNWAAYGLSWFTPTKVNVLFFKIQTQNYIDAFDMLKAEGLELDASARTGLDDSVGSMVLQKGALWKTTPGGKIREFCKSNISQISVAMEEIGHLRIFLIVWEPDSSKNPTLDGFKEFAVEHFKAQLTHAEWEKALRAPFKKVAKIVLLGELEVDE